MLDWYYPDRLLGKIIANLIFSKIAMSAKGFAQLSYETGAIYFLYILFLPLENMI